MTENTPSAGTARPPWTYILGHESWWAEANGITESTPLIFVQHEAYTDTGARDGVEWQFEIQWIDGRIRVDFEEFAEAVRVERPDLLDRLAELHATDPVEDVIRILRDLGFADATVRDRPSWLQAPA